MGGIESEDTFSLGVEMSNKRIHFSIVIIELSVLYVVRWTY
jgi:hypothetical protein